MLCRKMRNTSPHARKQNGGNRRTWTKERMLNGAVKRMRSALFR